MIAYRARMMRAALPPYPEDFNQRVAWLDRLLQWSRAELLDLRQRTIAWSWIRVLAFLAAIYGAYVWWGPSRAAWGAAVSAASAVVFMLAVRRHEAAREQARTIAFLSDVAEESCRRRAGDIPPHRPGQAPADLVYWTAFFESRATGTSSDASTLTRQEIDDLDLFADPIGLFALLNRTATPIGACRLATVLTRPLTRAEDVASRQAAIRWLADHAWERLHMLGAARAVGDESDSCPKLLDAIRTAAPLPASIPARALCVWGVLAGPATIAVTISELTGTSDLGVGVFPLTAVIVLNLLLTQVFMRAVRERLRPWLQLDNIVARLHYFTRTSVRDLPDDGLLGERRRDLAGALAHGCLPTLERRIPLLYLGLSGLLHTIIDVVVFWDLQVLLLLQRCYLNHREELLNALAALGECEMLASLACFAGETVDAAWPRIAPDSPRIEIVGGRHPLIPPGGAVRNSLMLGPPAATWIVTGSNMSGKSTYLRMIGLHALLAQIGASVPAERMTFSLLPILTDLRIRDDLSRSESYFLAEVRQLRRMVELAGAGRPFLGLIDEPFRGTNSQERIAAAGAVILSLIDGGGLHIIATHDAALTRLADDRRALNYHFRESFEKSALVFDYRLRAGPAESRNALRVLEAESYPPALLARANRILSDMVESPEGSPPPSA